MARQEDDEGVEIDLDGPVKKTTGMAVLITVDKRDIWLPRSQVHDENTTPADEIEEGEEGPVLVTTWWAEKEGFA